MQIAITGTSGYVGSRVSEFFKQRKHRVLELNRKCVSSPQVDDQVVWELGKSLVPSRFYGIDALVHCAYDFSPTKWKDIERINIEGFRGLGQAAKAAGVKTIILVSTISAFDGCRSLYGQAKLEMEAITRGLGGFSVRSGLVFGECPGGMLGRLESMVGQARLLPVIGARQPIYLCHEVDLAFLIYELCLGRIPWIDQPIAAACPNPVPFDEVLLRIASRKKQRLTLVPIPWRPVFFGMKALEWIGFRLPFRSDSLLGMMLSDPSPQFQWQARACSSFRAFL